MAQDPDLITVITPSLNQARFLRETVASVRAQCDPAYEHIILDGGSTDGTVQWLRSLADRRVRWQSRADRGQSDALNQGLALAGGTIIGWLNSDDRYVPGAFAAVRETFARNPGIDVVFGDYREIAEDGRRFRAVGTFEHGVASLIAFWTRTAVIGQPALFFRRRLAEAIGPFDLSRRFTMDWDYWIRARAHGPFLHLDRVLAEARLHPLAKTADDLATYQEQLALSEHWLGLLTPAQQSAVRTALADRRADLRRQREALDRVCTAVEAWLNRRPGGSGCLALYGVGRNGRRLCSRLHPLVAAERLSLLPIDDAGSPEPLAPPGTVPFDRLRREALPASLLVTPWEDQAICERLVRAGLARGRDFVCWSELVAGADIPVRPARSAAETAARRQQSVEKP